MSLGSGVLPGHYYLFAPLEIRVQRSHFGGLGLVREWGGTFDRTLGSRRAGLMSGSGVRGLKDEKTLNRLNRKTVCQNERIKSDTA